jgi:hypothetical protein
MSVKHEQAAIEAVARRFSASREKGSDSINVAGKRIAIDVATLAARSRADAARPRLRFDKVATRLIERVRATLGDAVPDGTTVLLTVTAPIRLASRTATALEEKIRILLARGSSGRDAEETIHGNRVRIRVWRGQSARTAKLIGFVHNPDPDPLLLLSRTRDWMELLEARKGRPATRFAGERWLAVLSPERSSWSEAYRSIYSQLRLKTDFAQVLVVFSDGRVEALTE